MSEESKKVNGFFKTAGKSDVEKAISDVLFTDRQRKIFDMFYVERRDVNFIADTLCVSADTVNKELRAIRNKIFPKL